MICQEHPKEITEWGCSEDPEIGLRNKVFEFEPIQDSIDICYCDEVYNDESLQYACHWRRPCCPAPPTFDMQTSPVCAKTHYIERCVKRFEIAKGSEGNSRPFFRKAAITCMW